MRSIASPFFGMTRPFSRGQDLASAIRAIFSASEPGIWLDPSDIDTLFQDSAGTTPVTAPGDVLAYAADRSPNENDAAQSTVGLQMVYRVGGNYPYAQGNNVDDTLTATLPDLGADATVIYADETGVVTLTGQTIGAGAYSLPIVEQLFGIVVVGRALTAAETERAQQFMASKRPDLLEDTDGNLITFAGDMNVGGNDFLMVA